MIDGQRKFLLSVPRYAFTTVVKVWEILGNAVPTPPVFNPKRSTTQISKKRRGTLTRTLRYADMLIIAIIVAVTHTIDRHNT